MASDREASTMLRMLLADKRETVKLDYGMYRRRLSITACKPIRELRDSKTQKILVVEINRLDAINYLRKAHDFLDKEQLKEELNDAATDICGTVQRI